MRILALGGCGQEGTNAVTVLANLEGITDLVIADLNGEKAKQHAARYGANVSALQVDVNDRPNLLACMAEADVVVSFVGPYYKFGPQILTAAIEAKKNFVDICDDPDATLKELELDHEARKAGISAVIGMGSSPGSFNVVARYGAQFLDEVHDIELEWCVGVNDIEEAGSSAALPHVFHMIEGNRPQFLNGEMKYVPAMSGEKKSYFPGFGEITTYFVGHPEPLTLPRYFPGLRNATNRGCIPGVDDLLRSYRSSGLASNDVIEIAGKPVRPRDLAAVLFANAPLPEDSDKLPAHAGGRIIVRGLKNGYSEERQYMIKSPLKMSPNTGSPAAVATAMMGRGQITTKGVFAPEGGVDPNIFMKELTKLGFTWEETIIRKGQLAL